MHVFAMQNKSLPLSRLHGQDNLSLTNHPQGIVRDRRASACVTDPLPHPQSRDSKTFSGFWPRHMPVLAAWMGAWGKGWRLRPLAPPIAFEFLPVHALISAPLCADSTSERSGRFCLESTLEVAILRRRSYRLFSQLGGARTGFAVVHGSSLGVRSVPACNGRIKSCLTPRWSLLAVVLHFPPLAGARSEPVTTEQIRRRNSCVAMRSTGGRHPCTTGHGSLRSFS